MLGTITNSIKFRNNDVDKLNVIRLNLNKKKCTNKITTHYG